MKYVHLRNRAHIFVQVQGHMFMQGNYIYWTLLHSRNRRNIYSKIVPSHFMIIISFTITISWIKYSYNFSSVGRWRNCWYDRGFRVVFATTVRRNTTRSVACTAGAPVCFFVSCRFRLRKWLVRASCSKGRMGRVGQRPPAVKGSLFAMLK